MMISTLKSKTLRRSFAGATLFGLVACGGGGDGANSSTNYVTWANNANGTVIVDANNQRLSVSKVDRSVVMGPNEVTLTGTKVDSNGNVTYNGTLIGTVSATTSTSGSTIAMFKCTDGSAMSFALSGNSYSYSCASSNTGTSSSAGTGSGSSGSTSSGSSPGSTGTSNSVIYLELVNSCVQLRNTRLESGILNWYTVTNSCGFEVKFYHDPNFTGAYGSLAILKPGQTDSSWWDIRKGQNMSYYVCPAYGPAGEDVYTEKAYLNCFFRTKN
jgi:hypothetical protein